MYMVDREYRAGTKIDPYNTMRVLFTLHPTEYARSTHLICHSGMHVDVDLQITGSITELGATGGVE